MSTEIHLADLMLSIPDELEATERADPVRVLAGDRPNTDTLPALADPAADHRTQAARPAGPTSRRNTAGRRLPRRAAATTPWCSAGPTRSPGSPRAATWASDLGSEAGAVLLYINRTSRAVVTDNVQSARVFEEELAGLGFQLKERPWYRRPRAGSSPSSATASKVASDLGRRGCPWPRDRDPLRALRRPLTRLERQRLRELGRTLTAGRRGDLPELRPGRDRGRRRRPPGAPPDPRGGRAGRPAGRRRRPARPLPPADASRPPRSDAGRRSRPPAAGYGLCASRHPDRLVRPGRDPTSGMAHGLAAMVDATCIFFSRPGETVAERLPPRPADLREVRPPRTSGRSTTRGSLIGYSPREALLLPDSPTALAPSMALCWSPSVGPARSEDTVVVDARGFEVVTEAQDWPKLEVVVKGLHDPPAGHPRR